MHAKLIKADFHGSIVTGVYCIIIVSFREIPSASLVLFAHIPLGK